jgi:glycosyltransferase involved in cell wall biosynthesis
VVISNLFPNAVETTRGMFVWQETRALLARYSLQVIAPLPWVPGLLKRRPKYAFHAAPSREQRGELNVFHPRHIVFPGLLRSAYGQFLYRAIKPLFARLRREQKPEFVVAHYAYPDGWAALKLARAARLPLLVKVRGSDVNVFTDEPKRRALTLEALNGADRVVAVSHALKQKMIELGVPEQHISVVQNGINTQLFHPRDRLDCRRDLAQPEAPFTFLFIGTMREIKGIWPLLDAVRRMQDRQPGAAHWVMIGGGEMRAAVAERIEALGLSDVVQQLPPVAHDDIPKWIGACDCLLLPSLNEGYPNVLVEALACARPVIASEVGGVPEIVLPGRTGLLTPPGDSAALAEAMQQMLDGFELDMREAAAALRSWQDVANDMSQLIEGMIAERLERT